MTPAPPRALAAGMAAAFLVALVVGLLGIGVRAVPEARAAVDEPQYLLSALSLAEDGDLDISDELRDRRWRPFSDLEPPVQTAVRADGRQISPHDPGLPVLLAAPMRLGGFRAAKATVAAIAGLAAALTVWIAVRRLAVRPSLAAAVAMAAFASPPLGVYAQEVYPEMPAALAVLVAVAASSGSWSRRAQLAFVPAVVALPWLSVKYVPIAATLAAVGLARLVRLRGRPAARVPVGLFAAAGLVYVAAHRLIWGGWTVYASGDDFQRPGEFAVVGQHPHYLGRTDRLWALLLDRVWGIGAWQPAWLLVVPAVAAVAVRRPRGWAALVLPAAAGWAVATWVALTMHGYWSPGRQLVVILPLLALVVAWWLSASPRPVLVGAAALGSLGVVAMAALLADGWAGRITWVFGFDTVHDPLYRGWRLLLPAYREGSGAQVWVRHALWLLLLAGAALVAYRTARRAPAPTSDTVASPRVLDATRADGIRASQSTG